MKMLVIFVVVFAAAVNSERCVEYGINYGGYTIETILGITHWSDCASRCNAHRSCSYWTWGTENDDCYLKNSKAGRQHNCWALSGSHNCLSEC